MGQDLRFRQLAIVRQSSCQESWITIPPERCCGYGYIRLPGLAPALQSVSVFALAEAVNIDGRFWGRGFVASTFDPHAGRVHLAARNFLLLPRAAAWLRTKSTSYLARRNTCWRGHSPLARALRNARCEDVEQEARGSRTNHGESSEQHAEPGKGAWTCTTSIELSWRICHFNPTCRVRPRRKTAPSQARSPRLRRSSWHPSF